LLSAKQRNYCKKKFIFFKFSFHDEAEVCDVGDIVQVVNAHRKLSKKKRFFFDKIIKKNPVLELMKEDPEASKVQISYEY
jgi:ribosomal protein S17